MLDLPEDFFYVFDQVNSAFIFFGSKGFYYAVHIQELVIMMRNTQHRRVAGWITPSL